MSDGPAVVAVCPACSAPISATDAFCEACGTQLDVATGAAAAPVDPATDQPDAGPRTHLLDPAGSIATTCHVCAATISDDGFCSNCGQRARSAREHWTESPSTWVGGVCDKGIVHARNEDAMALYSGTGTGTSDDDVAVLVVCDGVTTAPESDRASLAASRAACQLLASASRPTGSFAARLTEWQTLLERSCAVANVEAVAVARALGDPPEPPSCTFVAAVVTADHVSVAWCGDSRAYWIADDPIRSLELTLDHSLGTEMIAAGRTRQEAEADPTCHTITRWLGADSIDPTPDLRTIAIDTPGWVLVVSDGMWNYASSTEALGELIRTAVAHGAVGPTSIAESLAAHANACGGHDNVTVALARRDPQLP